jgi:hypothetical protein
MELEPDSLPQVVQALLSLLGWFEQTFGANLTLLLLVGGVLMTFGWRLYQHWREDREVNLALEEKEKSIQRLAADNRELRILLFKQVFGWSDVQVERYILLNQPTDGAAARRQLEGPDAPVASTGPTGIPEPTPKPPKHRRRSQ